MVNKRLSASLSEQLHERHDASDFELRTAGQARRLHELERRNLQ
jgi:hypothetical protein